MTVSCDPLDLYRQGYLEKQQRVAAMQAELEELDMQLEQDRIELAAKEKRRRELAEELTSHGKYGVSL